MEKILTFKIPKASFIRCYLLLFNGGLKLTNTELSIVEEFISAYLKLKSESITEEQTNYLLFSTPSKKDIREKVGITSEHSFNNCISSLKKKGVIIVTSKGNVIASKLIPSEEVTFKFNLQ